MRQNRPVSLSLSRQSVADQLQGEFPGLKLISGPGLHRAPATLTEVLVDCSAERRRAAPGRGGPPGQQPDVFERKREALVDALVAMASNTGAWAPRAGEPPGPLRALIFCNSIERCRQVTKHSARAAARRRLSVRARAAARPQRAQQRVRR